MPILKRLFVIAVSVFAMVCAGCHTKTTTEPTKTEECPTVKWDNLGEVEYIRYHNPRFGFFIEYPSFMLKEPSPENGDGISCRCQGLEITAYGSLNIDPETGKKMSIERVARFYAQPADTIYALDTNAMVVRGVTENGNLRYRKFVTREGLTFGFEATYDSKNSRFIEPLVDHMAESFDCSQPGEEG